MLANYSASYRSRPFPLPHIAIAHCCRLASAAMQKKVDEQVVAQRGIDVSRKALLGARQAPETSLGLFSIAKIILSS